MDDNLLEKLHGILQDYKSMLIDGGDEYQISEVESVIEVIEGLI